MMRGHYKERNIYLINLKADMATLSPWRWQQPEALLIIYAISEFTCCTPPPVRLVQLQLAPALDVHRRDLFTISTLFCPLQGFSFLSGVPCFLHLPRWSLSESSFENGFSNSDPRVHCQEFY